MSDAPIIVRPAAPDEAEIAYRVLDEAARWLWDRGIPQWQPGSITLANVQGWLAQGVVLLAWRGVEAVGTVTILWDDAEGLWVDFPGAAGYIHKLAVRRTVAGTAVSLALLDAAHEIIRAKGLSLSRLDCWAGNDALRRFYGEKARYSLHAVVTETDENESWLCALFERDLL
jgi:GNAT superfamily N-acetyltransferase